MKRATKIIFFFIYILFVGYTFALTTPPTLVDAIATLVIPAVALWGIYWTHVLVGDGLLGLLRKKSAKSEDTH
jgi:hypothetical protein